MQAVIIRDLVVVFILMAGFALAQRNPYSKPSQNNAPRQQQQPMTLSRKPQNGDPKVHNPFKSPKTRKRATTTTELTATAMRCTKEDLTPLLGPAGRSDRVPEIAPGRTCPATEIRLSVTGGVQRTRTNLLSRGCTEKTGSAASLLWFGLLRLRLQLVL
ncbi:uncharacterized protein LOC112572067 [Pomacea canaliculata]|uniref:uncharacterized protein LOC112572067 n=1 Tax=Pomacea canaliculata TaxID=400727 RepID=UPI000D729462|nr:uncharacterized protein LOC112572067 [Pomacea canaliculata]